MTPDEVKQSITTWCSSDDDLEIASDRFEPGTDFSFGLKAGTLSTAPVELVVLKADGADRVTIRRSVTLTGDNVDAANQLVASRPGSVTASVERSGADTTVVAQTYVYLDGLSKHTFVQAVAELARTSTLLDAIGGVETASEVDEEAAVVASDAVDADAEPELHTGRGHAGNADAGGCRLDIPAVAHPVVPAAEPGPVGDSGRSAPAHPELHAPAARPGSAGAARIHPATRAAALPGAAGTGSARAAARGGRRLGAEPFGPPAGTACVGCPGSVRTGGRQPRAGTADPGRGSSRCLGAGHLLQRLDRLDRRPDHRRRCLTSVLR